MIRDNVKVFLFPLHRVPKKSRIVIWGMGQIGKRYLRQILETEYCNVAFTVDENLAGGDFFVPIYAPDYIREHRDFDYIVIAIGNNNIAEGIKRTLLAWGIDESKIVYDNISYHECISFSDEYAYLPDAEFLNEVRRLLKIYAVWDKSFVRCGNLHDGGYVMVDDFSNGGIAYSFGISNDVSWDDDMADKGYNVFMYDHTIKGLPKERSEFHFFKKGIADSIATDMLDTLEAFVYQNGHESASHMILKMDVEGAEWGFLEMTSSELLHKFDQIVLELHGFLHPKHKYKILSGLHKLSISHAVVHVHANNYSKEWECDDIHFSDVLEVTWANRNVYNLAPPNNIYLPISLDAPCCAYLPEIVLGNWNEPCKK